ncbi:MAG: hypothetical protein HYR85_19645 [Planctomycetes bacterium]|nr:hypothetical protein [Planctomycetota bacterium]MBI3844029.1 hypothetical protein [Planctomycetota bacterium]
MGAGGMGEVYRTCDVRLDRSVAIKVLPERFAANADVRQRFEREAKAVSSLNDPHICTLAAEVHAPTPSQYDVVRHPLEPFTRCATHYATASMMSRIRSASHRINCGRRRGPLGRTVVTWSP